MKKHRSATVAVVCTTALIGLWASDLGAQHKRVFATSVGGSGNLGDPAQWPDNGGLTGLAAADAICRARAAAGGLANPEDFVAWLSDSTTDAYCRIHGLSGTKATNCGQSTLPGWAGPWVRMDGHPFAERIDLALRPGGLVYAPVYFDEFGERATRAFFTGTNWDGEAELILSTCGDWTAVSSDTAGIGAPYATTDRWSFIGFSQCHDDLRLLCMEAGGPGPPLPPLPVEYGAVTFVTSATGTGDLSSWPDADGNHGIAAGDAICQSRARAAGLDRPESFKAWLSDGTIDAADRITTDGPWVRLDGVPVFRNKWDLTQRLLFTANNLTETGEYISDWALTGSSLLGVATGSDCSWWTDGTSATATAGLTPYTDNMWTSVYDVFPCSESAHLYCLSDTICWRNAPHMCLDQERFTITVEWEDFSGNTGEGLAVPLTTDTGYFWFFDEANVELVVKVLDGTAINGYYWVFYGALTNVGYTLTVTDNHTGISRTYTNPSGTFASAGDTEALPGEDKRLSSPSLPSSTPFDFAAEKVSAKLAVLGTCAPGSNNLCLNGDRFHVEVDWVGFDGASGKGTAVPLTGDTGYFWFFDEANVELIIKVLDGTAINGHNWVFYGALTNVEYTITVTDTATGEIKQYHNPSGVFASEGDTEAFEVP